MTARGRSQDRALRRAPTPRELASSPELAILAAIEAALDVGIAALVAAQPELWTAEGRDAVTLATPAAEADTVILCAQSLAIAITAYRQALRDEPLDLPF